MRHTAPAFPGRLALLVILVLATARATSAPPVIASFSPSSGPIGSSITITGANFASVPGNNVVYFGGVKAPVTAASTNSLTVKAPVGATHSPISVTVNRLTAYSRLRFVPTFASDGFINEISFGPRMDLAANWPGWFEAVAVADLDGDGKPELITTINHTDHSVWIRRNISVPGSLSEASLAPPVTLDYGASGISHGTPALADLDGDGKLDVVVWNDAHARFAIFRNNSTPGTISFALLPYIDLPPYYTGRMAIGDIDVDGKPDLLVGVSGGFGILRNISPEGDILFESKVDFPFLSANLATADLDADGKPDVIGPLAAGGPQVWVARNTGVGPGIDGNSLTGIVEFATGLYPYASAIGDLDGDGKLDLVANNRSDNTLSLLRNLSTPGVIISNSFAPQVVLPTGPDPAGMGLGDLNGDGKLEIATANGDSTISVFKSMAVSGSLQSNSFAAPFHLPGGVGSQAVSIADLDGDGKPEIIATLYDARLIAIYPNKVSSPPSIAAQPASVIAAAGAHVELAAAVTGWPLDYQWAFQGTNLPGATNAALTLTNVQFANAGTYALLVSNALGIATSSNAALIVRLGAPIGTPINGGGTITLSPQTNQYTLGQTVTLTATPRRYYAFSRWSDGGTNSTRLITITGTNDLRTAIFTNTVALEELVFKQWEAVFGGTDDDYLTGVATASAGGFILGGHSSSGASGNKASGNFGGYDYWVVKLDASGSRQWETNYGGTGDDILKFLAATDDGGCVLVGNSSSGESGNKTSGSFGSFDYWVVKLDADGSRQWEANYGGTAVDYLDSLALASDGGYILGGYSSSDASGNKNSSTFGSSDFWVVKLDANGSKQWETNYGGVNGDVLNNTAPTPDGGYILGGYSLSGASGNKTSGNFGGNDYWVVKVHANGTKQWETNYGGAGDDYLDSLAPTSDGGYILGGYSSSGASGNKTSGTFGSSDFWVVKLDANGSKQWETNYGGINSESLSSVAPVTDGGYILGGHSLSGASGNKTTPNFGSNDYWVVKVDVNGTRYWETNFGGTLDDNLQTLMPTTHGVVLGGASQSDVSGNKIIGNFGASDYWIINAATREAPVGTPVALINGVYSPSNTFLLGSSNSVIGTLQTTFSNGSIFYTLDDSMPTTNSLRYTGPFQLIASVNIRAVAYSSNRTQSAEMDAVPVTINNTAPTIAFNPSTTFYLNPGSNALLSVTAADADGAVTRVEFHQGTNLLQVLTNAPYDLVWTNPPPGRHSVTARAYDAVGAFGQAVGTVNVVDGTIISGFVAGQTWPAQSGPYYVAGNVQATNLTIGAGAFVRFGGNYQFEVLGSFSAVGSNSAPVLFTTDTNVSGWGGIYFNASSGTLRMEHCIVERSMNSGLRIHDCSPVVRHCTIRQNSALHGGGVWTDAALTLETCTVSNNQGGGVYSVAGGTLTLRGCRVRNNLVLGNQDDTHRGGAAIYSAGPCLLYDCDASENRTLQPIIGGTRGGGLWIEGPLECYRTTISSNEACAAYNSDGRGGGVAAFSGAVFSLCVLQGNKQGSPNQSWGGAVYCFGTLWMTNCLVTGNQATSCGPYGTWVQGSAVFAYDGVIENCTISYNALGATAFPSQAAIGFQGTIRNSIAYFNTPAPQIGPGAGGGDATVLYCDVQGGLGGVNNIDADPLFANNTNYLLAGNSPAIDAGDPDPLFHDACFPPSLGTQRNDLGAYGGPFACGWSEFGVARPTVLVNGQSSSSNAFTFGSSNVVMAEIQSPFSNGAIFYTLDGSAPSTNSVLYTGPIQLVRSGTLWAIAFNSNRTEIAITYRIAVTINNNAPIISLTAPTNGSIYIRGQHIALAATASDSDGTVQRLEFYAGANLLATLTNTPWSLVWSNVQGGNYTLRAVAYDPVGARSTSSVNVAVWAPVTVDVQGSGSVNRSPDNAFYPVGENVMLTAIPARYYRFVRWSTGETNASVSLMIGATNLVSASFTNTEPLEELLFEQQQRSWGGNGEDQLKVVLQTRDGGLLLAGESSSPTNSQKTAPAYGQSDWWLIKLNASGNEQWQQSYGGSGGEILRFARQTTEGGYILGGYSTSGTDGNKTAPAFGGEDWWLVKISAAGVVEWQQTFGVGPHHDNLMDGLETADGGYLLAGSAWTGGTVGNKDHPGFGNADLWLVKVNALGAKQWEQTYGGAGSEGAHAIVPTPDGGYLLAGQSTSGGFGDWDWWVVNVDALGQYIWEQRYGGSLRDDFSCAVALPDGTYMLGGYSMSGPASAKDAPNYGDWDYWMARIDASGVKLWDRSYGGGAQDALTAIVPDRRGGFLLGGLSYSISDGNKGATNFGFSDWWTLRTDITGTPTWEAAWGGAEYDSLATIARLNDGYLLGGSSTSGLTGDKRTPNVADWDWWTIKLASREAPVGMPALLVNGQYSPSKQFLIPATNAIEVSLQTSFPDGFIYYALSASQEPGIDYAGPFSVTQTVTIRAIAYNSGFTNSPEMDPVTITVVPVYTLTPTVPGGGGITLDPPGGQYFSGATVQLTATNVPGWTFLGWSRDAAGTNNPIAVTMDRNKSIQAMFGTTISTAVVPPSSGSLQRQPAQSLYAFGQKVRVTAFPAFGRYFTNWVGGASNYFGDCIDFEITNAAPTVTARFATLPANTFALTVDRIGNGAVTRVPGQLFYTNGQSVQLTAVPDSNSAFVAWSGIITSAANPLTVVMNANKAITANFSERIPAISSFSPASGPIGTMVTIEGTNFNSVAAENMVHFGGGRASVIAASATSLTVIVPATATCQPITVTTVGRTAYSRRPFIVTFASTRRIDISSFSQPIHFSMPSTPRAPITADLDVDGKLDVLTANSSGGLLTVFQNTSVEHTIDAGSLTWRGDYPPQGSLLPYGLARGDLNGDGRLDVAIPTYYNQLFIYQNRGAGESIAFYSAPLDLTFSAGSPVMAAIADLDLDGKPDLIVPGGGTGNVLVFRNRVSGVDLVSDSFAPPVVLSVAGPAPHLAVGDLDGDGKPDLAVAARDAISVLRNTSSHGVIDGGSFAGPVEFPVVGGAAGVAIADLDGDGRLDLIAANYNTSILSIFRNTATAGSMTTNSFGSRVDYPSAERGWAIEAADLDGDAKLDLVVANYTGVGLSVFRNTSVPGIIDLNSFAAKVDFATSAGVAGVAIADIDLDGKPDLVAADDRVTTNSLFVLKNRIPAGVDPPVITITSPTNGAAFIAPATVAINASVIDGGGIVTQVVFFAGNMALGTDANPLFAFLWNNVAAATYELTAVAMNDAGATATSGPVTITVSPPANQPPLVSIINPTNGALFIAGSNILISVSAADPDGSIASLAFFAGTNLLGVLTNGSFSLVWSNAAAGPHTITVRATDNGGAGALSEPKSFVVREPEAPPAFRLEKAAYSVNEGDSSVTIRVVRNFTGFATVNFATDDNSANAGADYVGAVGQLDFQSGETIRALTVTIREDAVVEGDHIFTLALSLPSTGTLTNPSTATITIVDNDEQTTNSFLSIKPPDAVDENSLGSLRVFLTDDGGFGRWRLAWERTWRSSGAAAAGLPAGNYEIQFKPVSSYQAPDVHEVAVRPMQETRSTNAYTRVVSTPPGSLTVVIDPSEVGGHQDPNCRGQWQRDGEGVWHNSGETVTGLPADNYLIHFRTLQGSCGWGPPADRFAVVLPGVSNALRATYYWNVAGASTPEALIFSEIQSSYSVRLPYAFNGQIVTDRGEASGFVVKERVVLTAAHVVFDDYEFTWMANIRWLFQRHVNDYNPPPQTARGYYVLGGYSAQRQAEGTPGVSTPASHDLDVAALYFHEPAGRGGYGGYLVSDSPSPQWLQTNATKVLVGYPVEGILDQNRGKMHAIRPRTMTFAQITNAVFASAQIRSFPGNSGGPLYVLSANNYYYPAGVYVGGAGNAIARAIDLRAVDLINRAELAANRGTNNTGGGAIRISLLGGGSFCDGYATVTLLPPEAFALGAAWRVAGSRINPVNWVTNNSVQDKIILQNVWNNQGGQFQLEFRAAEGFLAPAPPDFQLLCGSTHNLTFNYVQLLPRLDVLGAKHILFSGITNSRYRLEYSPQLSSGAPWVAVTNFTLPPTRQTIIISNVLSSSNGFYRGIRVP